jgi:hypothetical protein
MPGSTLTGVNFSGTAVSFLLQFRAKLKGGGHSVVPSRLDRDASLVATGSVHKRVGSKNGRELRRGALVVETSNK